MRSSLALLLLLSAPAYAIEPFTCRNGHFPTYTEIAPGEIATEAGSVHASNDTRGCPGDSRCLQKGYLVNGDRVLTAHPAEGWVCIYYLGKKSDYTGWVKEEQVKTLPSSKNPPVKDWLGYWETLGKDNIIISEAPDGMLRIEGKAFWFGGKDSLGYDIVHFGEISGTAEPTGNSLTVKDGDDGFSCVAKATLVGSYMVVSDNSYCGGMNVRFNSIYRRGKP